jgi:hypothetical protein
VKLRWSWPGVVASPGPAAAASQSCATINGVMDNNYNIFRDPLASGTIVDTSTLSIVSGTYVPLATSRSYVLSCGTLATPEMPRLGERFYVLMDTYMRYQTLSSNVVHTFRLPTGLYPAVDANNPVVCWTTNGSVVTPKSCTAAVDTGLNSPGWGGAFSWYLNATTYQLVSPVTGDGPVIGAGLDYFTLMPVVATRPFSMASLSDRLWASAWIHFPGGAVNSYAFSDSSLRALDRNPEPGFPATPVTGVSATSATVTGQVFNYWKAGNAVIEYG